MHTADTITVHYAHDVLAALPDRHVELFWESINKRVSYGDAELTLVSLSFALSWLSWAALEYSQELGTAYTWDVPACLKNPDRNTFFAISG